MKRVLFIFILFSASCCMRAQYSEPPAIPATTPNPDYPIHIHIFGVRWNRVSGYYEGYGRGDLLGAKPIGIDYTFSCAQPFLHNAGKAEFYQAKWKKQDQRLEILMQKIGSDHLQKCELKTSPKAGPYGKYDADGTPSPTPPAATTPPQ